MVPAGVNTALCYTIPPSSLTFHARERLNKTALTSFFSNEIMLKMLNVLLKNLFMLTTNRGNYIQWYADLGSVVLISWKRLKGGCFDAHNHSALHHLTCNFCSVLYWWKNLLACAVSQSIDTSKNAKATYKCCYALYNYVGTVFSHNTF